MSTVKTIVSEKRELIDARLIELVMNDGSRPTVLGAVEPIKYICSSGGKRLRSILLLLSCETQGGDSWKALDAAAAMEMIHASSLIFDDLIDRDSIRRRRTTVHIRFGQDTAISIGLFLASRATQIMASYRNERIDNRFAEALVQLSKGELLGVLVDHKTDLETYLEIAKLKTSSLFMASASIGAILGGATESQADAMSAYGRYVGLAFQIRDDILDSQRDGENLDDKLIQSSPSDINIGMFLQGNSQVGPPDWSSRFLHSAQSTEEIASLCVRKANSQLKLLNIPVSHIRLLEDFADHAWARKA